MTWVPIMNIYELMEREQCTPDERRRLLAYYLSMKLLPNIEIIHFLSKSTKLI